MNKKTVVIVCLSLILAIIAVSVIATFPTYLFEENEKSTSNSDIQSENITEQEAEQGEDIGVLAGDDESGGIQGIIPDIDNSHLDLPEPSLENYDTLAESNGAFLLSENSAFPDETEFKIDKLGIFNKKYYRARHYIKGFANKFIMYNVSALKDGKTVIPTGIAKLAVDIPEKYDIEKLEIYYLLSDGGVIELDCNIDKTNRTATVGFTESGVYILIERKDEADIDTPTQSETGSTDSSSEVQTNSNSEVTDSSENSSETSNDSSNSDEPDSSDTPSTPDEPDEPEETDPNKDSMNGWRPWF